MTRTPDVELVLRDYFAEDGDLAPDRVLEVVAERISSPSLRPRRLLGRPLMNTYAKLVAGLAAVLIVGIVGWRMLPGNGIGGPNTSPSVTPAASPSPAPSASPSAGPTAGAVFPQWYTTPSPDGTGILAAGTTTTRTFLRGSTFSVPAGWVNSTDSADFFGLFPDTSANEAEFGRSGNVAQNIFMAIVDTPSGLVCDGIDAVGSTAAGLADSLVANDALVTSNRVDVTIGGLSGARVDAFIDPASPGTCPTDYRGRFVFLDSPRGKLMIIIDSVHTADFDAFVADAMPIVEGFQFNAGQ